MLPTSEHFNPTTDRNLYFCKDGTPYPEEFADKFVIKLGMLEKIRRKWNAPISIVSGYRSKKYNNRLVREDKKRGAHGVASGSKHVTGEADDIQPRSRFEVPQLYRVIMAMYENGELPELGGIGMYPMSGWIHVDIAKAPDGHLRKWTGT